MNEPGDKLYDRWREDHRETEVPEGFADRVMASVRHAERTGPHPEGWLARLDRSRGGVAVLTMAAAIAVLVRVLGLASLFVD